MSLYLDVVKRVAHANSANSAKSEPDHLTQISQISQISRSQNPPMTAANADLFTPVASELPDDVARGLQVLASSPPLWPVHAGTWAGIVGTVKRFADCWDCRARSYGWSSVELYGLAVIATLARADLMGAAWMVATSRLGLHVTAVNATAIEAKSATGAPLRIYRPVVEPAAALPWNRAS